MLRVDAGSGAVKQPVGLPRRASIPIHGPVLRQRLAAIHRYAAELEPLAAKPLSEYLADYVVRRAAERLIQLTVDAITGAADLIVRETGHEPSTSEPESLAQVQALGVISEQLARVLMQATGLRNRLVHAYQRIDDERVLAASGELVRRAREYVAATEEWLSKHEAPEK
jgi:uncharacterized protein YutE (UPF0331/DUF86 family)